MHQASESEIQVNSAATALVALIQRKRPKGVYFCWKIVHFLHLRVCCSWGSFFKGTFLDWWTSKTSLFNLAAFKKSLKMLFNLFFSIKFRRSKWYYTFCGTFLPSLLPKMLNVCTLISKFCISSYFNGIVMKFWFDFIWKMA